MEVNRDKSASFNSTTSVGSTDSKDSGFGVNDATSQVGHMNGSTVAKGPANQKPSSFFGWLKSLLGFGGSSSNSSEKTTGSFTVSPKFAQKMADKDPLGDQHDAAARTAAIDDNIEIMQILVKENPTNQTIKQMLADAKEQSKLANNLNEKDSLEHQDLVQIKGAFDKVRDLINQASKLASSSTEVVLHPTMSSEEPRGASAYKTKLIGRTADLKGQVSKGVSDYLESLDSSEAQMLRGYMKTVAVVREQGTGAPLENSQIRAELERDLKHKGINYNAQTGVFSMAGEDLSKKK